MAIRRSKIKSKIEKILTENNITKAPVPVVQIAKASGARISAGSLEGDLSGFLYRDNEQVVIGVNNHHSQTRQNFTIAHELGHLLLHDQEEQLHVDHAFRVRLRNDVSSQGINEAEREANLFAASLLMPEKFIEKDLEGKEDIDLLDDDCLNQMARKYGVSSQAFVNRLKNLGYIQE